MLRDARSMISLRDTGFAPSPWQRCARFRGTFASGQTHSPPPGALRWVVAPPSQKKAQLDAFGLWRPSETPLWPARSVPLVVLCPGSVRLLRPAGHATNARVGELHATPPSPKVTAWDAV